MWDFLRRPIMAIWWCSTCFGMYSNRDESTPRWERSGRCSDCWRNITNQRLEVDDLAPILRSIQYHWDSARQFFGLRQRQGLHEFIQGAKPAGKDHQRAGEVGKPQLSHEEIPKVKGQPRCDVAVCLL